MSRSDQSSLAALLGNLTAGRISRRSFISGASALGISAGLAGAIAEGTLGTASAAPGTRGAIRSVSLQDGGKTLVVAITQTTVQLDPAIAGSNGYGDIIPINENLYEGLTRYKNGTNEIEPALAESWTNSADGLSYVFKLRSGVTFHDGTPLDAKAVETNFVRQLDENDPLHDPGMVYAGVILQDVSKVEATGDLEVTLTLDRPIKLVPANLAVFAAGIVSPTALQTYKDDYSTHAAGTGPFKLDHWTKDVELVFVANDQYWGGRPKLDRVIWRTIADDTVKLSELTTGGVDVANQIDFKDIETVQGDADLQIVSGPFWNVQFLGVNAAVKPFDSLQVRQALQYAINKQNIADAVFYGHYTLGAGPIAPGLLGYDASLASVYSYDPEKAKSLIAEAGVSDVSFDLYNRTNSVWPLIGQLIQADLEAVGIKANIVSLEDAEFFSQLGTGKTAAFLNDWTWDNGDPDNVTYSLFSAPRAETRLGYKNDRVNELNTLAQEEADQDKRAQYYAEMQKLILDDAINVFLGYPDRAIGAMKTVQGLVLSPIGNIVLRDVDVTQP
jgi:peptide/nickel transport system substrate-binding protein